MKNLVCPPIRFRATPLFCGVVLALLMFPVLHADVEPLTLPEPVRVVSVSSGTEFFHALNDAEAGDHIELEGGVEYQMPGTFTITRHGTAENPIVIRTAGEPTAPEDAATITSPVSLRGDHIWLFRVHLREVPLEITRHHNVLLRSWFIGYNRSIIVARTGSSFGRIEYCHIEGPAPQYAAASEANRGFTSHGSNVQADWILRRTHFKNIRRPTTSMQYLGGAFGMGHDVNEFLLDYNWLVEYCYFENIETDQATNIKGSGNTVRYSVFDGYSALSNRGGQNNRYHGLILRNTISGVGGVWMSDENNEFLGVVLEGGGTFRLFSGTHDQGINRAHGATFPSRNTLVAGCTGDIFVGYHWSGQGHVTADNTTIEASFRGDGTPITSLADITTNALSGEVTITSTTDREIPQPVDLTPDDVGPNAFIDDTNGYPSFGRWVAVNAAGDVDDADGFGWINILHAPWVYFHALNRWAYVHTGDSGDWVYLPQ